MKKTLNTKLSFKTDAVKELTKSEQKAVKGGEGALPSSSCSIAATNCVSCNAEQTSKARCA